MTATTVPAHRGALGTLRDIYHERTHFDFIGKSWLWALISGSAVVIAAAALLLSGLNLGIDFQGGRQWEFKVAHTVDASQVRDALKGSGIKDPKILILGNGGVRVQSLDLKHGGQVTIAKALAKFAVFWLWKELGCQDPSECRWSPHTSDYFSHRHRPTFGNRSRDYCGAAVDDDKRANARRRVDGQLEGDHSA